MAFGDKLKWKEDTADNTQPPLFHVTFPRFSFDATLHEPVNKNGLPLIASITYNDAFRQPSVSELLEAARLKELEEAAKGVPSEVTLAEKTLIEICGNKFMSESVRTRAAQLILERYDQKTIIAQLQAELDELKAAKTAQNDDGELPPHLARKRR